MKHAELAITLFFVLGIVMGWSFNEAWRIWRNRPRKTRYDAPTDGIWKRPSDFWR